MAESIQQKMIREANVACEHAYAATPDKYRGFIVKLSRFNKRMNVSTDSPYMRVDGRVQMARDEHLAAGKLLNMSTTFEVLNDPKNSYVCQATVVSELRGAASGVAIVNFDGSGADSTNPLEVAQTSAIGRALGFLGYGLLATGIASAEEVLAAMDEQDRQRVEAQAQPLVPSRLIADVPDLMAENPVVPASTEDQPDGPASSKQIGMICAELRRLHVQAGHKKALIWTVVPNMTKQTATGVIDRLTHSHHLPSDWINGYVRQLMGIRGVSREEVVAHIFSAFGTDKPARLSKDDQIKLIDWLTTYTVPVVEVAVSLPDGSEDDDIYFPKVVNDGPAKAELVQLWFDLTKRLHEEQGITLAQVTNWVLANYAQDGMTDVVDCGREAYESVKAMEPVDIAEAVATFEARQEVDA